MKVMRINQKRWISESGDSIYRMLVPIVFELLLTFLIGSLNQLILNRFSENAVAATTGAGSFLSLMLNLYAVSYVGQGILLAACSGKREYVTGGKIWVVSILDNVLLALIPGAVGVFAGGFVLTLMQTPDELFSMAREYLGVALGLSVFQGIAMTSAAAFRAVGDMKTAMMGNVLINGSCVLMNGLILVCVPFDRQRIYQYALAGVLAQLLGVCFYFQRMRRNEHFRSSGFRILSRGDFPKISRKIFGMGFFGGMEGVIYLISQTAVMSLIAGLGTRALMVKGYCGNLFNYLTLPASAVPLAAATAIGMSIGMQQEERALLCFRKCMRLTLGATLVLCFFAILFGRSFLSLYVEDEGMLDACVRLLYFDVAVELCRSVAALMVSSLKAIGDVRVPFFMVIAGSALNVGISWLLGIRLGYGLYGIWAGYAADLAFRGLLGIAVWRKHVREHAYPVRAALQQASLL